LPETAEVLANRAENRAYRMEARANAAQAHQDAVAERGFRLFQTQNEATILANVYSNQPVDMGQVADMARNGLITPGGLDTIHAAVTQGAAGHNDTNAVVDLYARLGNGQLSADDVHAAVGAHQVSGNTALELMRAINEQGKQGASATERGYFSSLRTAMQGGAVEAGMFGRPDQAPVVQRWAQAQQEWTTRVRVNHEDPAAVYSDMSARYAQPTAGVDALPRPLFGAVTNLDQLNSVALQTVQARQQGRIDQATYDREKANLTRLKTLLENQPVARPTPTVPGRGGPATGTNRPAPPPAAAVVAPTPMFGNE